MNSFNNLRQETPERIYNEQTGVTTYQYLNGNTLTEYPDGSRVFFDVASGKRTGYNAKTKETTTYDSSGQVIGSSNANQSTINVSNNDVAQNSNNIGVISNYDPATGNTFVQNYDGLGNTAIFNATGKLISSVNGDIPTAMKAAGLGIPDQPVQEFRTYGDGNLEDGQVRRGFVGRVGWESTYNTNHASRDEVVSGVHLNSEGSFNAQSFMGVGSKGEAGIEWNKEQAHLHAQGRVMAGAEANVDGRWKETLDVEGVSYKPGAEVQGNANAFAGAELEGRGDLNVSSDGARGQLGGEAFAGAKAEASAKGGLSVDNNEFARGEGGVNARAGIGAEAKVDVGYQDGQIDFGANFGAALGVGAGYTYKGSVDAPGIVTHPDAVLENAIPESVSDPLQKVGSVAEDSSGFVLDQVQSHISIPQEVDQAVEVVNDPVSAVADFFGGW